MSGQAGHTHEQAVNGKIAEILNRRHGWTAKAERSRRIVGNRGLTPDIVVEAHGTAVVVETEYPPAAGLDGDVDRLAEKEIVGIGPISSTIGMKIPKDLKQLDGGELESSLSARSDFQYYVKYRDCSKFPSSGYLKGSLSDLAAAINLTSIPWDRIHKCVSTMQNSIKEISNKLEQTDDTVKKAICTHMRQNPSVQTWDMAGLIILNAGIFYEGLAAKHDKVVPLSALSVLHRLPQKNITDAWDNVMGKIDYVPIFRDAVEIVRSLPAGIAGDVLDAMHLTVSTIVALKVSKSGDVYGSLYQSMLEDRKKIAAFYTRPEAAALLTGLVMPPSDDIAWKDDEWVKGLRIADFACGTGMLLTHAYHHIRHSTRADMSELHKHVMENCFYGYDIMPTATHLTVSNLAGLSPDELFDMSHIYTLPMGKKVGGAGYNLGSLDLIEQLEHFTDAGIRHGGHGSASTGTVAVRHRSCDYILMNPPYARATNHGGSHTDPVPPFAVFGNTREVQQAMADRCKKIYSNTCAHGNAGLASYFVAICDKKLKLEGAMGLILPSTVLTGAAWSGVRQLLAEWYDDITLILAGGNRGTYSSDTHINETLLIARHREASRASGDDKARIKLVLLERIPASRLEAIEIAKQIRMATPVRMENDVGDTSVKVGNCVVGRMLDCPTDGDKWWVGNVLHAGLFSLAYKVTRGLDGISMTGLNRLGNLGKIDRDIADNKPGLRAPFQKTEYRKESKYACLWGNDSDLQQAMVVVPDCSLEAKHNVGASHVNEAWRTATRVHINRQVGYASQRLIAAYTRNPTLGGSGWPNMMLDESHEKAFTVWCNSLFGILTYWMIAGSQQGGRGRMSKIAFETFPVLDFARLSKKQLAKFDRLFDKTCVKELLPINRIEQDATRQSLDKGILGILGIEMKLDPIYKQLVREPQFARKLQK